MSYEVSDQVRRVPPRQRQLLALLLAPVAGLLLVAGVLIAGSSHAVAGRLGGVLLAVLAAVLLAMAHGLYWSARRDRYEASLDAAALAVGGTCGSDCDSCTDDCAIKALPRRTS